MCTCGVYVELESQLQRMGSKTSTIRAIRTKVVAALQPALLLADSNAFAIWLQAPLLAAEGRIRTNCCLLSPKTDKTLLDHAYDYVSHEVVIGLLEGRSHVPLASMQKALKSAHIRWSANATRRTAQCVRTHEKEERPEASILVDSASGIWSVCGTRSVEKKDVTLCEQNQDPRGPAVVVSSTRNVALEAVLHAAVDKEVSEAIERCLESINQIEIKLICPGDLSATSMAAALYALKGEYAVLTGLVVLMVRATDAVRQLNTQAATVVLTGPSRHGLSPHICGQVLASPDVGMEAVLKSTPCELTGKEIGGVVREFARAAQVVGPPEPCLRHALANIQACEDLGMTTLCALAAAGIITAK